MAPKPLILLPLFFSLFFISQVSSDHSKKNEETSHLSQALHVFSRGGERMLMHNLAVMDISKYFEDGLISRGPAPGPALAPGPNPSKELDCGGLCTHRCSLHSRQNMCLRACGTCCVRCKCVPPGTFGNREMCGKCYTEMTTHGNKTKCP